MRKTLALFFLFLFLLNTAGYYLVFEGWKWRNSLAWSDDGEAAQPEIIVKIPYMVPYQSDKEEWEPSQGGFDYQGEAYRIVKRKVTEDAVYIAIVKDNEGTRINGQLKDFAKSFTDKPDDSKQSVKTFPGFIKEYVSQVIFVKASVAGWTLHTEPSLQPQTLVPSYFASIVHPPERA